MTRLSLALLLGCAVPSYVQAQSGGVISGTVSDADGQPLPAVEVRVEGLGISAATGASGRYVLARVLAGQQLLEFRKTGYSVREVPVMVRTDTLTTADAVLGREPLELGAVVVEGVSRAPDRLIEASAAVAVVRPAVAAQAPLALTRMPGLDVAQAGVTDFNVNARGFNTMLSRKVLVLQDGRDLGTAVGGTEIWGALSQPAEDVDRIEVIRGPGSALYGPNAYNGVINITTPPAREVLGTKLTVGGGGLSSERADLRHAGALLAGRVGYRVNLGYTRSADWVRSRTSKDSADLRREYAPVGVMVPLRPPESLPLLGQITDSVTGRALGTPDPVVSIYGSARVDYYPAAGSEVTFEGGAARLDNSVFMSGSDRTQAPRILRPWARVAWTAKESALAAWYSGASFAAVTLGAKPIDNYEHSVHLDGRTSRRFHGDAGRVVVGASVQDNHVDSRGTVLGVVNDNRSDQYYGAFAQLEYGLGRLRVIGALRWDDSDLFRQQLSPKGALVFSPARNHALRFTVDRALLAPSLVSEFARRAMGAPLHLELVEQKLRNDPVVGPALTGVTPGTLFDNSFAVPDSVFGNRRIVPQTMTSYELGYKGQLGRRVFVTIDAYDAHIPNFATGLLPAGTTHLNPDYTPWTAPIGVPVESQAMVDSAVLNALALMLPAPLNKSVKNGLTRLIDGTTAVVLSYGNAGVVDEWGVELGGSVSISRTLTVTAGYTWYNWAIRHNLPDNVLASNTPHNKGAVALGYSGQRLDFDLSARFVSRYHWSSGAVWDGDIPASQTVDLNGGYRIDPHLRLYISGTDILNQQRFEVYGGAVIGRRVLVGVTSTF